MHQLSLIGSNRKTKNVSFLFSKKHKSLKNKVKKNTYVLDVLYKFIIQDNDKVLKLFLITLSRAERMQKVIFLFGIGTYVM